MKHTRNTTNKQRTKGNQRKQHRNNRKNETKKQDKEQQQRNITQKKMYNDLGHECTMHDSHDVSHSHSSQSHCPSSSNEPIVQSGSHHVGDATV